MVSNVNFRLRVQVFTGKFNEEYNEEYKEVEDHEIYVPSFAEFKERVREEYSKHFEDGDPVVIDGIPYSVIGVDVKSMHNLGKDWEEITFDSLT